MKALIADDERLAREELKRLLSDFKDLEVVCEAGNTDDVSNGVMEHRPDLMFLDIEMPGEKDVFSMLESLEYSPLVIFTTAYSQYALQAFEHNTLDYLLKPIDPRRLEITIERVRTNFSPKAAEDAESSVLDQEKSIFVRDGNRCWFVKLAEICLFESEGNYTRLYFEENRPLILRSLNTLQAKLDPGIFFRASRKHIINLNFITAIVPSSKERLEVVLDEKHRVPMSRRQSHQFKTMMSL